MKMEFDTQIIHWFIISLISLSGGLTKYLNIDQGKTPISQPGLFFAGMSLSYFTGMLTGALCFYFEIELYRTIFLCGIISFFSSSLGNMIRSK